MINTSNYNYVNGWAFLMKHIIDSVQRWLKNKITGERKCQIYFGDEKICTVKTSNDAENHIKRMFNFFTKEHSEVALHLQDQKHEDKQEWKYFRTHFKVEDENKTQNK